jgi:multiple antibiotic resistance protein
MGLLEFSVNFFVALFALLDPVGNVPIFAAATGSANNAQRRWVAFYISLFAMVFLAFFYFTGLAILQFFGVSMEAFRIAGGILLFLLGLDMARGDFIGMFEAAEARVTETQEGETPTSQAYARKRFENLIVPFGIPLLIGPGAISTVIIQAAEAQKLGHAGTAAGFGVIVLVSAALMGTFFLTSHISKLLGRIGMVIVIRVLGLILCAMAVQFIISGIGDTTANLIAPNVAHPYSGGK